MADYIIVGAGSAGCVLAHRLSADPDVSVLLLEAGGPDDHRDIQTPIAYQKLYRSEFDWALVTEPQEHLAGRSLYWPRGKGLGGSSSINAMIYIRGQARVYDEWAEAGADGWSFAEVLPYFRRAEDQQRVADVWHGVGGPLSVVDQVSPNPLSRAFIDACAELGFPRNTDFNGASQEGAGLFQVTQRAGLCCSAATAYLHPVLGRGNLDVRTAVRVEQLVLEGRRVTGVRGREGGEVTTWHARREVILAAGAVHSPQLLLLSGIGPAETLRSLGIPVHHDLPGVGENLQDHLAVPLAYECREPVSLIRAATREAWAEYRSRGSGPLASNVAEAGLFLTTPRATWGPDLQFHFVPGWFLEHGFRMPEGHGFTLCPTLLRPASRGRISLRSPRALDPPRIEPRYFEERSDLELLREGVVLGRKLASTRALARYRGRELEPGDGLDTEDELAAFLRARAETLYHPVGTCRMGSGDGAVVDPRLRVRGVHGLRVIDASIMPRIPNGNTNAPTIMIAEKGADLTRGDAG